MKNRLRVLRAEHDRSQAELAERPGVSRQTVNAIETEKYDPSLPLAFIEAIFSDGAATGGGGGPAERRCLMSRVPAADPTPAGAEPWRAELGPFAGWFFAAALLTIGANLALREFPSMPVWVRAALVAASVPALVMLIVCGLRVLRAMDELDRRIQLETLGCAFGVIGLLLVAYGQVQTAFKLTTEPWTMVWPMMYCVYGACLVAVRRRYV